MRKVHGGITAPKGYAASGIWAGLKRKRKDLGIIYSDRVARIAGVLTTHQMAAAPIELAKHTLHLGKAQAIVVNSGNANACTGPQGGIDAGIAQAHAASVLEIDPLHVVISSTGVIGKKLPMPKVLKGIEKAAKVLDTKSGEDAAEAILTTDLVTKSIAVSTKIDGVTVKVGAMAKGSGMIDPNMATMLCFITTDANVTLPALRHALKTANMQSFNAITVDGQMSTNDSVFLMANGAAGNRPLSQNHKDWPAFQAAINKVTTEMARAIVHDGEGASRFLKVDVTHAKTTQEARKMAKAIANAPLIKTMVKGQDPNWGRVAATIGALGIAFDPQKIEIQLGGLTVFKKGEPVDVPREKLKKQFKGQELSIAVALHKGAESAQVYTCDLTEGYIHINAEYN